MSTAEQFLPGAEPYGWKRVVRSLTYRAAALFSRLPARVFTRATQYSIDVFACALAVFIAYQLRFDSAVPASYRTLMWAGILALPALRILSLSLLGAYHGIWRYFNLTDVGHLLVCSAPVSAGLLIMRYLFASEYWVGTIPVSVIVLEYGVFVGAAAVMRSLRRITFEVGRRSGVESHRALIVGTPDSLAATLRQVGVYPDVHVVGMLATDVKAKGMKIGGFSVIAEPSALPRMLAAHAIDVVLIADAGLDSIGAMVATANEFGVDVRLLPSAANILRGDVRVSVLPKPDAALVDRALIITQPHPAVIENFRDKRVLITGAGGSIGAELSRQVAGLPVDSIILLDHDENSVFEIDAELQERVAHPPLIPVVADIRDRSRLRHVFERYRPHLVLHAAAYKHVPMMEQNCCEAVLNNIVGTREVADAAIDFAAERFLMISTDKAVHPSSIMGATKRAAEILVQSRGLARNGDARTFCSCVRFGNVVGSRGSVVPIFLRQIAAGGPITITHEEMTRYFMTIPEAVQLVLQAVTLAIPGQIYMLDMGDPVRITDMARRLIELSGLRPGKDIEIQFVGARPGEKIHEQLWYDDSSVAPTDFPRVLAIEPPHGPGDLEAAIAELEHAARTHDDELVRSLVQQLPIHFKSRAQVAAAD